MPIIGHHYDAMLRRPDYRITSPQLKDPLHVTLNLKDAYVRIGSPYFKVLHVRESVFNPQYSKVYNAYGARLFTIRSHNESSNHWLILEDGHQISEAVFSPIGIYGSRSETTQANELYFSLEKPATPNRRELLMMVAACTVCHLENSLSYRNYSLAV